MFIAAQIFGALVIIANISAMQMEKKVHIILCFLLANLFSAINFLLLGSYTGALICSFAIAQILINNQFEKNNKPIPIVLIAIYIIISLILGYFTYHIYIDILPIICSIVYTINILQHKERRIRQLSLSELILWIIYDIFYMAYTQSIADALMAISAIIGMYRFDFKKRKN